eukprot:754435-Hanusia_phi.AAC.3
MFPAAKRRTEGGKIRGRKGEGGERRGEIRGREGEWGGSEEEGRGVLGGTKRSVGGQGRGGRQQDFLTSKLKADENWPMK